MKEVIKMKSIREIDLTLLPENAKKELIDFYEFLLKKYGSKEKKDTEDVNIEKFFLINEIQIDTRKWKFSREEIYE